jgi:excisionase family DNA binding protein
MSEKSKVSGLSVYEVAAILEVTAETVRRYIRDKKLRASKQAVVGLKKEWVISREAIAAFKEENA